MKENAITRVLHHSKDLVFLGGEPPADPMERLKELCQGNENAMAFCISLTSFCHLIDDLQDADKAISSEDAIALIVNWSTCLAFNPFFLQHKEGLMSLITQGASCWLDSELCAAHPDRRVQAMADALKSFYGQALLHVANIIGGWEHMREMSSKYRVFDFDKANQLQIEIPESEAKNG